LPAIRNGIDLIKNVKNHVVYVFKSALSEKRPVISAWGVDALLPSLRSEVLLLKNWTIEIKGSSDTREAYLGIQESATS
jgi:hypothetical protein